MEVANSQGSLHIFKDIAWYIIKDTLAEPEAATLLGGILIQIANRRDRILEYTH